MASKRFGGALLALATILVLGCSKTEDTSPERRLFGTPSSIESVQFAAEPRVASCDVSEYARAKLCLGDEPGMVATLEPDFATIRGTYSDIKMKVAVHDAESTPAQSDVLLVGASYVRPETTDENTLVLFDDGSTNQFPPAIKGDITSVCTSDESGFCQCDPDSSILLNSGDTPPGGDEVFERTFALYTFKGSGTAAFQDCIQKSNHEAPLILPSGAQLDFRIDVTDRSGNLTTWPERPRIDTTTDTLECLGDQCFCCIFVLSTNPTADPPQGCRHLPGLKGPSGSGFENGYCIDRIP